MRVVLHTTGPMCDGCHAAARVLAEHDVPYAIDASDADASAHQHAIEWDRRAIPTTEPRGDAHTFRPNSIAHLIDQQLSASTLPPMQASLPSAAREIRATRAIVGESATSEDCRIRARLINEELHRRGVVAGERVWFTAQLATGQVVGMWATSPEQAELGICVWWEADCHWVVPDDDHRVRGEYFPSGIRTAVTRDARFPVGPPRRPRDRFAPTESLLAGLDERGSGVDIA